VMNWESCRRKKRVDRRVGQQRRADEFNAHQFRGQLPRIGFGAHTLASRDSSPRHGLLLARRQPDNDRAWPTAASRAGWPRNWPSPADSLRIGFLHPDFTNAGSRAPTVYYFWKLRKTNIISGINIKKCII
jgi:hypothetical protein